VYAVNIEACRTAEVIIHQLLTLALGGEGYSTSVSGHFILGKEAFVDEAVKREMVSSSWESKQNSPTHNQSNY
jgi:hypothetical protein